MKFQGILLIIVIFSSILFSRIDNFKIQNTAQIINSGQIQNVSAKEESTAPDFNNNANARNGAEYFQTNSISNNLNNASTSLEDMVKISTDKNKDNFNYQNLNCSNLITAKAALLKNLNKNANVIYKLNNNNRWPIASITKLMTAAIALENIDKNKEIIVSEKAVLTYGESGDLKAGYKLKMNDLLQTMLVVSSNDAAVAIAESFGQKDFIMLMNKKAGELNMNQTFFVDSTGLSFLNQSTADDLAKLADYIYANHEDIFDITKKKSAKISVLGEKAIFLTNINKFSGQSNFLGGKTGFIDEAGRNLISLFKKDSDIVLSIILGANDAFEETGKLINCQNIPLN